MENMRLYFCLLYGITRFFHLKLFCKIVSVWMYFLLEKWIKRLYWFYMCVLFSFLVEFLPWHTVNQEVFIYKIFCSFPEGEITSVTPHFPFGCQKGQTQLQSSSRPMGIQWGCIAAHKSSITVLGENLYIIVLLQLV